MQLKHMIAQARLIQEDIPSYRVGQHFCNLMSLDSSEDPQLQKLWNSTSEEEVMDIIYDLMGRYQWKGNFMPTTRECKYLGKGKWEFVDLWVKDKY